MYQVKIANLDYRLVIRVLNPTKTRLLNNLTQLTRPNLIDPIDPT